MCRGCEGETAGAEGGDHQEAAHDSKVFLELRSHEIVEEEGHRDHVEKHDRGSEAGGDTGNEAEGAEGFDEERGGEKERNERQMLGGHVLDVAGLAKGFADGAGEEDYAEEQPPNQGDNPLR